MTDRLAPPGHVIVVNGGKMEPYRRFKERYPDTGVSVITEAGHRDGYAGERDVRIVEAIECLDQVRAAALDIVRDHGEVDGVMAPSERMIPTGGYLRTYLGLPGYGFDESIAFTSKLAMKRRLERAGVRVAHSRLVPRPADVPGAVAAVAGGVVVKPSFGIGTFQTHALDAGDDGRAVAEALAEEPGPFLVEERIDVVEEFHCDGVVVGGRPRFASVSRYFVPALSSAGQVWGSHTLGAETADARAVLALHDRVVEALGLRDGVTHLEVMRSGSGEYVVGEIACRPGGGGVPLVQRHQFGVDTLDLFLDANLGRPLSVDPHPGGGVAGWCQLPVSSGRVESVVSADELARIDGVVSATVTATPGAVVGVPLFSTSNAGLLLLQAPTQRDLLDAVDEVRSRYAITIQPLQGSRA